MGFVPNEVVMGEMGRVVLLGGHSLAGVGGFLPSVDPGGSEFIGFCDYQHLAGASHPIPEQVL